MDVHQTEPARTRLMVDVVFAVTGGPVVVDHGYPLFGALCRVLGNLHDADWLAVHPLRGSALGGGRLALRNGASLTLRIEHERIPAVLPLAGKSLEIAGGKVHIGVPQLRMLRPAPSLVARTVIFKNHVAPETFLPHVIEELARRDVRADVELGKRRIVTIAGKKVVGFRLALHGLLDENAMQLQADGLGGRRRFGCGVFVPVPRRARGGADPHE
jgi:CRISPR-associated protein Cas6